MSAQAIFNSMRWQVRLFGYRQGCEIVLASVGSDMHVSYVCNTFTKSRKLWKFLPVGCMVKCYMLTYNICHILVFQIELPIKHTVYSISHLLSRAVKYSLLSHCFVGYIVTADRHKRMAAKGWFCKLPV